MNQVKRRLLLKILALNLFFNGRKTFPFNSGVNDDYESDLYGFTDKNKPGIDDIGDGAADTVITGVNETQMGIDEKYEMDSSRQLKVIRIAVDRRNIRKMIELTNNYIENNDLDLIEELREGWDVIGREYLPMHLYDRLYYDEIEIELS